jgi:hypothetical protein
MLIGGPSGECPVVPSVALSKMMLSPTAGLTSTTNKRQHRRRLFIFGVVIIVFAFTMEFSSSFNPYP